MPIGVYPLEKRKGLFQKGHPSFQGMLGKHHSEETKRKIRIARAKQIIDKEAIRKLGLSNKGIKRSLETRAKMKISAKKRQDKLWLNSEYRKKMSLAHKGKFIGKNHPNWKGGITPKIIQRCNSLWWKELRKLIYQRDNWTCQICNKKCYSDLQCHHIIPESKEGNNKIENLITLCRSCHIKQERNGFWKAQSRHLIGTIDLIHKEMRENIKKIIEKLSENGKNKN